jgi:hypothetical protein
MARTTSFVDLRRTDYTVRGPPALSINRQNGWLLDYDVSHVTGSRSASGSVVRQTFWLPQDQRREAFIANTQIRVPVFFVNVNGSLGVPLMDPLASESRNQELHDEQLQVQLSNSNDTKITIRIAVCTHSFSARPPPLTVCIVVARL